MTFADAGCQINHRGAVRFHEYIELLIQSPHQVIGFQGENRESVWTTEAVFSAFNVSADDGRIRKTGQIAAGSLMLEKGRRSEEWLSFIFRVLRKDPFIITDRYNEQTARLRPDFKENRHDQSVMSVSRKIKGFQSVPAPKACQREPIWYSKMRSK